MMGLRDFVRRSKHPAEVKKIFLTQHRKTLEGQRSIGDDVLGPDHPLTVAMVEAAENWHQLMERNLDAWLNERDRRRRT